MSARRTGRSRLIVAGAWLVLAGAPLGACSEVESAEVEGYEPSHVETSEDGKRKLVTFTDEGARRTGLQTAVVAQRGAHRSVPYEALLYDGQGASFVYASPKPLTYERAPVAVARIEGDDVLLEDGPATGSTVVTVGASEVYGAELEIAGSH